MDFWPINNYFNWKSVAETVGYTGLVLSILGGPLLWLSYGEAILYIALFAYGPQYQKIKLLLGFMFGEFINVFFMFEVISWHVCARSSKKIDANLLELRAWESWVKILIFNVLNLMILCHFNAFSSTIFWVMHILVTGNHIRKLMIKKTLCQLKWAGNRLK